MHDPLTTPQLTYNGYNFKKIEKGYYGGSSNIDAVSFGKNGIYEQESP
jgi:hypothetical protein